MHPGVYDDLSNAEYHGGPGISKSGLDLIARSPAHFLAAREATNDNRKPTAAQAFGSDFHEYLLEPDSFDQSHVLPFVAPEGAVATSDDIKALLKECGAKISGTKPELMDRLREHQPDVVFLDDAKHAYAVANAGRTILQADDWDVLRAMKKAVMDHPAARKLLTGAGRAERSVYWTDDETGELCRCRPDYWRNDGVVVDLKTTEDASLAGFAKSIANYRYHVQDPFYRDGINAMRRQANRGDIAEIRAFVFVAVEKKFPHAVGVYMLDNESCEVGRMEARRDLDAYARCAADGVWPAYSPKVEAISLPAWRIANAA